MSDFHIFAKAVNAQLKQMMKDPELYIIVDTCDLFDTYLAAFPEGSDPIFRTRTWHDCSCCKNFIRNMGGIVGFKNNQLVTIWDISNIPEPYNSVATRMREMVRQYPIAGIYRTKEHGYGAEHTYGDKEYGANKSWDHLWAKVEGRFRCDDPAAQQGARATQYDTLKRSLEIITLPVMNQVLELASQDMIYRGAEHVRALTMFKKALVDYNKAPNKNQFVWENASNSHMAAFKNTVIGSLVMDLHDDIPMEDAVRRFEAKVAPHNYKRSKSLITGKMVDDALATLAKLNLESAINRRVAVFEDISVNDVLFVNNIGRMKMKDGLKTMILKGATKPLTIVESKNNITIDKFISEIVPTAESIRLLVSNRHAGNFMTLTAPQDSNTGPLLKWSNNFGWSYRNDVTDSIRERVKRAGGNVDNAKLRVSLSWFNGDDLDLHSDSPFGHVYYGAPHDILDVDMNAGSPRNTKDPVENQSFKILHDGTYSFSVNQFSSRFSTDVGFEIELAIGGAVWNMNYMRPLTGKQTVQLFQFDIIKGVLKNFITNPQLENSSRSQDIWGVQTEQAHEVTTILNSPNHWENAGAVGQKHWFFILDGCATQEPTRGLYNEFLRGDLDAHRKVFEILGSKTMCAPLPNQMSGLGFTKGRDQTVSVITTVNSKLNNFNITF